MKLFKSFLLIILFTIICSQGAKAQDWPNLNRYRQANAQLEESAGGRIRVVFMGDSITDFWIQQDSTYFANNPYIDRGISGQTTPQMLIRLRSDAVQFHPDAVAILAGTNDIAGNTGPSTLEMIENNLASMSEIAEANNIKVILCSVLPAYTYPWNPKIKNVPQKIKDLNKWIKKYTEQNNYTYCNYYSALANENGGMIDKYSKDGVHPNKAGYEVMEEIINKTIDDVIN